MAFDFEAGFTFEDAELLGNEGLTVTSISVDAFSSSSSHASSKLGDGAALVNAAAAALRDILAQQTFESPPSQSRPQASTRREGAVSDGYLTSKAAALTSSAVTSAAVTTQQAGLSLRDIDELIREVESKGQSFRELDDIFAVDASERKTSEPVLLSKLLDIEAPQIQDLNIERIREPHIDTMNSRLPPDDLIDELVEERDRRALKRKQVPSRGKGALLEDVRSFLEEKDCFTPVVDRWEQLRNMRREQPSEQVHFETNRKKLMQLADDLNEAFGKDTFQSKIQSVMMEEKKRLDIPPEKPMAYVRGRKELVRSVHNKILPAYGYSGKLADQSVLLSLGPYCDDDEMLGKMRRTDELLGLPPCATLIAILAAAEKVLV